MEQPQGTQNQDAGRDPSQKIVTPSVISSAHQQQASDKPKGQENKPEAKAKQPRNTWKRKSKRYLLKFCREGPDRHIELLLAVVIAFFAFMQWSTADSNGKSATAQTDQLITAAKINAAAAQQNALAAGSFATTEEKINQDLQNAVNRLDAQAGATSDVANAAAIQATADNTIAGATQQSAGTAQDALYWEQRPWLGIELIQVPPPIKITGQSDNKTTPPPPFFETIAHNFGRTPALRWNIECSEFLDTGVPQDSVPDCDQVRAINQEKRIDIMVANRLKMSPNTDPDVLRQQITDFERRATPKPQEGKTLIPDGTADLGFSGVYGADQRGQHYAVGKLVYHDAIRPDVEHSTNYCLQRVDVSPWRLCDFGQNMN